MSDARLPRRTVTFLFSDIEDSTDLVRRLGDEPSAKVRAQHHRLLRKAFEGRVPDTIVCPRSTDGSAGRG